MQDQEHLTFAKGEDSLCGAAHDRSDIRDQWLRFLRRNLFPYKLSGRTASAEVGFTIDARSRTESGFTLARVKTTGGQYRLIGGHEEINCDNKERYVIYLSVQGDLMLGQFAREVGLGTSEATLMASFEPLSHTKLGNNDTVCFLMPREFVDQRVVNSENKCVRLYKSQSGLSRLALDTLLAFERSALTMNASEFQNACCLVGDLLLLSFSGCDDSLSAHPSIRAANLCRVKRLIRARLEDPDLTLADIANGCEISLGYLHNLFRDDGFTAWAFLRRERLHRARQLLQSLHPGMTRVTSVAVACGFSNVSYFSTTFKKAFGVSPRDVATAPRGCPQFSP